jgi:cysteinyl-tRNA synthetase
MVTVDGVKMGKSLGNFTTIKETLERYNSSTLRFFILSSHYRSTLDFSHPALEAAEKGIEKLLATIQNLKKTALKSINIEGFQRPFEIKTYRQLFEKEMNDDFNTPRAIAVLFDLTRNVNSYLNSEKKYQKTFIEENISTFQELAGDVLGLIPNDIDTTKKDEEISIDKIVQLTINIRNKLRKENQFLLADFLRDELGKAGIKLTDKPEGTEYEISK